MTAKNSRRGRREGQAARQAISQFASGGLARGRTGADRSSGTFDPVLCVEMPRQIEAERANSGSDRRVGECLCSRREPLAGLLAVKVWRSVPARQTAGVDPQPTFAPAAKNGGGMLALEAAIVESCVRSASSGAMYFASRFARPHPNCR